MKMAKSERKREGKTKHKKERKLWSRNKNRGDHQEENKNRDWAVPFQMVIVKWKSCTEPWAVTGVHLPWRRLQSQRGPSADTESRECCCCVICFLSFDEGHDFDIFHQTGPVWVSGCLFVYRWRNVSDICLHSPSSYLMFLATSQPCPRPVLGRLV